MEMSVRVPPPLPLIFLLMIHWVSGAEWAVNYNPLNICALKDSSVIIGCNYKYPTGHQVINVFWTKGRPGKPSNYSETSQRPQYLGDKQKDCTIRLSHVTKKDEDQYYFTFKANVTGGGWTGKPGVSLSVTDLQVESPERVKEGDSVRLTCKSSCKLTDTPTYIWYRNSQKLTARRGRNNELLLQSVRREDAGRYRCAVHGHTLTSPDVNLNVTYPPKKVSVSISGSGEIVSGDSVTLSCSSDSNPPGEIYWYKGTTYIAFGRIFSISKITSEDSGEYKCRAINDRGDKYSDPVTLNVMYPPRSVSVSITEIVSGGSVSLSCISDSNPPALTFSWFIENQSSSVGSGQSFSAVQSGRFYCEAHNPHGSQRSDAITVTVKGHLVIICISLGGVCAALVVIMMLLLICSRRKKRNYTESQVNYASPRHDTCTACKPESTDPVYGNILLYPMSPLHDRHSACDEGSTENIYHNELSTSS